MSAILMTCDKCGTQYMAGAVGVNAWPAHTCPAIIPHRGLSGRKCSVCNMWVSFNQSHSCGGQKP